MTKPNRTPLTDLLDKLERVAMDYGHECPDPDDFRQIGETKEAIVKLFASVGSALEIARGSLSESPDKAEFWRQNDQLGKALHRVEEVEAYAVLLRRAADPLRIIVEDLAQDIMPTPKWRKEVLAEWVRVSADQVHEIGLPPLTCISRDWQHCENPKCPAHGAKGSHAVGTGTTTATVANTATGRPADEAGKALVQRLRDTPNWMRESWGGTWKNTTSHYDRTPFEAADYIERLENSQDSPLAAMTRERDTWKELATNAEAKLRGPFRCDFGAACGVTRPHTHTAEEAAALRGHAQCNPQEPKP